MAGPEEVTGSGDGGAQRRWCLRGWRGPALTGQQGRRRPRGSQRRLRLRAATATTAAALSPGEQRPRGPSLAGGARDAIFSLGGVGGQGPIEIKLCCHDTGCGISMSRDRVEHREGHAAREGAREPGGFSLVRRLRAWPISWRARRAGRPLALARG